MLKNAYAFVDDCRDSNIVHESYYIFHGHMNLRLYVDVRHLTV
jgi:hypothetical protein